MNICILFLQLTCFHFPGLHVRGGEDEHRPQGVQNHADGAPHEPPQEPTEND